jgi:YegS/Rv2252/BmrU family lipid kinase
LDAGDSPADVAQRPTTALLIRNPVARHAIDDETLSAVIDVAAAAGWRIETIATDRAGRATELARDAAARGVDVVVVHGGDGTLSEAANGLAGTATALATLRGGTANVWAKETHCPKDAVAAMRQITDGRRLSVDLGRAGDRYFLLMAGIGLDAAIVPRVHSGLKRRLGVLAYIIAGAITLFRTKPVATHVVIDGAAHDTPLFWLLLGNTRSYGGVVNITRDAIADDGMLEVALMRRGGPFRMLADGARALLGRLHGSRNVLAARAREIDVTTAGLPVQIDGELHGETPMRFTVAAAALQVIVARDLETPLFSRG